MVINSDTTRTEN